MNWFLNIIPSSTGKLPVVLNSIPFTTQPHTGQQHQHLRPHCSPPPIPCQSPPDPSPPGFCHCCVSLGLKQPRKMWDLHVLPLSSCLLSHLDMELVNNFTQAAFCHTISWPGCLLARDNVNRINNVTASRLREGFQQIISKLSIWGVNFIIRRFFFNPSRP